MISTEDFVVIGSVGAPYGVHGWFRVNAYTEEPMTMQEYPQWYIKQQNIWQPVVVNAIRAHGKSMVASLEGVTGRDEAMQLTHAEIAVPRDVLPTLSTDEFYWHDLLGMRVFTPDEIELGEIKEIFKTGANDVMVVQGEREHLIPFILEQYVLRVDTNKRHVIADWDPEF